MAKVDFSYQLSDERLLTYCKLPLLERLRWLDEIRRFTLLARQAPAAAGVAVALEKPAKNTASNDN